MSEVSGRLKQPWQAADERLKKEMLETIYDLSQATAGDLKEANENLQNGFRMVADILDKLNLRVLELERELSTSGGGNA